MDVVLVHSPLVGPSTWAPVAAELGRRGYAAAVPVLDPEPSPDWRRWVAEIGDVVQALPGPVVVAGHSGGGLLVSCVATQVAKSKGCLVFVDAGLPDASGETPVMPPSFHDFLVGLAGDDGMLPPWPQWWGDNAMSELVADPAQRAAVARECPALPLAYFDERVTTPAGWESVPCAYLQLSDGYADAASEARERGWPVESIDGAQHLHTVVAPGAVTAALLRLAGAAMP
jgi:pimeloyl-ACP methyl ester carboxylesterase